VLSTTTPSRPFLISTTAFIAASDDSSKSPWRLQGQIAEVIELSVGRIAEVGRISGGGRISEARSVILRLCRLNVTSCVAFTR